MQTRGCSSSTGLLSYLSTTVRVRRFFPLQFQLETDLVLFRLAAPDATLLVDCRSLPEPFCRQSWHAEVYSNPRRWSISGASFFRCQHLELPQLCRVCHRHLQADRSGGLHRDG